MIALAPPPSAPFARRSARSSALFLPLVWLGAFCAAGPLADPRRAVAQDAPAFDFTRMVAHWDAYADPRYLDFIDEARPELVQLGFYGAHFWSLAHTPAYSGYPAHFPVRGLKECGDWFERRNAELRRRGVKVVGHFNVEFLVGDPDGPEGPRGFFKFYRELWDERELGPRPVADPLDLLEKRADGTPISQAGYGIGGMREYWACLRNPHWRQVLKAWTRRGVERGVDGFMINYFYRHDCLCEHCVRDFKRYLADRYDADRLRTLFGIEDLDAHRFPELVAWHDPRESTPLRREMLRFSQISNKRAFDEVFLQYGRSLKPDLIVGQWNHLGNFSQVSGDERCLLPAELWARGESYAWYSTGDSANSTDLARGLFGDATLQARYLRGALDGRRFTLGKYENTRIRAAIAELAANGGAPMGFYARFTDPAARAEFARYYGFLRRHEELYRGARSHAETALVYPRRAVQRGDLRPLDRFRSLGARLLDEHLLFDVVPDDLTSDVQTGAQEDRPPAPDFDPLVQARLSRYKHVLRVDQEETAEATDETPVWKRWDDVSRFRAPPSVRVSVDRAAVGERFVVHLVNYNRDEPPQQNGKPSPGGGIQDEKPKPVRDVAVDLVWPAGRRPSNISIVTPEAPDPRPLEFQFVDGRLRCQVPEFLVYAVLRIESSPAP